MISPHSRPTLSRSIGAENPTETGAAAKISTAEESSRAAERYWITELSRAQFLRQLDHLILLHLAAMNYALETFRTRKQLWRNNANQPGFRCFAAIDRPTNTIVGVCYGFSGHPLSWWYQQVSHGLRRAGHSTQEINGLLHNYLEVSEVHVHPQSQGRGLGEQLLRPLLHTPNYARFLLSTPEVPGENNPAWRLYRKLGFQDVLRGFHFPHDPRPFGILSYDPQLRKATHG